MWQALHLIDSETYTAREGARDIVNLRRYRNQKSCGLEICFSSMQVYTHKNPVQ
jgi:uncharacterized protein YegP (UPF0339 family)